MKKRLLSILLTLCMMLTLLPTAAFAAGETSVGTIEELMNAIKASATPSVKLTADINGFVEIPVGKTSITIDLNGNTLTNSNSSDYFTIKFWQTGTLTIKDSAGGGSLTYDTGTAISSEGGGTVVIESGAVRGIFNGTNGTLIMNGGTVTAFASYYNAIENSTDNTICTINGGTVTGSCSSAATTKITGGSVNATFSGTGTVTNAAGVEVTMYTLTLNGAGSKAVTSISFNPSYTYGVTGAQTDSSGKLYVWLPASYSGAVTATTADGSSYSGTISGNAATLAPSLTGTVTVSGTMKYNQQLTATVTGTNNTGSLAYQWKRGDTSIGTGATYTTVAADVGQTLTCVVTSSTQTGSITSAPTAQIAKADSPAAPSVTFSFDGDNANKLMGATTAMEYSLDGGVTYNFCTAADMTLNVADIKAEKDIMVRVAETDDTLVGAVHTIDILPGDAIPDGTITTTGCTSDSNDDGKLSGVTATMEYQKSGTSIWTGGSDTAPGVSNGSYLVRYKATGQKMAGPETTVTVAEFVPTVVNNLALNDDVTAPIKGAVPSTEINDDQYTGTVSWNGDPTKFLGGTAYTATVKLSAKQGYTFTGVGAFTYTGATSVTPSENNGSTLTLTIVFPATEARELASIAVTTQPKLVYKYEETFSAVGMEVIATYDDGTTANVAGYSIDLTGTLAIEDTGKIGSISYTEGGITKTAQTDAITVNKADGPSAPSVTFSFDGMDANKLMGATTAMEYRLDGGSDESGWLSCSDNQDLTDSLTSITDINDIKVRVKATNTHEAGTVNTINITKATTPTSPAATDADVSGKGTLTGVTTDMEYQKSSETVWITGTGSTILLDPGTYYVRVKAASTKLASDNQTLTIGIFVKGTPTVPDLRYDLSAATYDDAPQSVTVTKKTTGIGDLTVKYNGSTTPPTNVGTYAITVDITETAEYKSVSGLPLGNFVINKAEYSGNKTAAATVRANRAENNLTVTLPDLPNGASYPASGTVGGTNSALIDSHSIGGTTLTFNTTEQTATSATITIPVNGANNYNSYNVVVTITAVDKEIVTIDGLTAAINLVYNGTAQKGYTGTVAVSDNKVHSSELLYTYTSTDGGGYNAATAPTDAGAYKLVVSVADTNGDYTGAHADITFTIAKATITVTAKDKSAYVGDTAPVLGDDDYTVTGLVSGETLKTKPTIAYASAPDMTKTGTMAINITGTVAPDGGNYNVIIHKEGVLIISNRPSSGGGGSYTPPLVTEIDNGGSVTGSNLDRLISGEKTLTVDGNNGAKLVFGTEALKEIDGQSSGNIKVEMKDVSTDHQGSQPGKIVFSLTLTSGDKTITDFGGSATVSLPYELKDGETAADVTVWYLAGDGAMTEVPCSYDPVTKLATFTVTHFSLYVVGVDTPWVNPFTDVAASDWFYGAVEFANRNSLFAGTGAATFSPNRPMTRAMLWTVLARLDGQSLSGSGVFDAARLWAMSAGITDGTNPNGSITREQMVTILWRYAGSPKVNSGLSKFLDVGSVASYAADAMAWAVENGIIAGANSALMPQDNASRVQVAAILQRFIEATAK